MKGAGTEGKFEQLLMKARLEEAKIRDLVDHKRKSVSNISFTGPTQQTKGSQHGNRGISSGSLSKLYVWHNWALC